MTAAVDPVGGLLEAWSGAGRADASKGAGLLIQCGFVKNLRKL